jgi:lysophospholipase L1-like esterase
MIGKHARLRFTIVLLLLAVAAAPAQTRWVGTWATSQQLAEPANSLSGDDRRDATLRQIVHLSIGGREIRVGLSNRFGAAPLHLNSVHIARATSPRTATINPATDKALTFSGSTDVIIPAGAEYLSDPIQYQVAASSDLAISIRADVLPERQTGHPGSRATSYVAHGDLVSAAELPDAKTVDHWYFIAAVQVVAPAQAAAVVVLGDSITDGHGATTNGNDRWPDVLARRLQSSLSSKTVSVLNHGIGGNRLLLDGLGPNALARVDHDIIAQAGARYVIVLEGINDIGTLSRTAEVPAAEHQALVHRMIAAYEQIVARSHTHGIKVYGATILPFVGSNYYHPGPAAEADRQAVNEWIRARGHFDAVVDFDKIMRDPEHPDRMLPQFDSGDHLHPSPAGYKAMGDAVPLAWFALHKR